MPRPRKRTSPFATTWPMIAFTVVERPTPLRPSRLTISPALTSSVTPCSTWLLPYQACRSRTSSMGGGSEVGLAHLHVSADLGGRAARDDATVDEHRDAVGEPEDHAHVVL